MKSVFATFISGYVVTEVAYFWMGFKNSDEDAKEGSLRAFTWFDGSKFDQATESFPWKAAVGGTIPNIWCACIQPLSDGNSLISHNECNKSVNILSNR